MSIEETKVVRYFYYFLNEKGKKTQSVSNARIWIDKGMEVTALLTDTDENDQFFTEPISTISISETDYKMAIITKNKIKYLIKARISKSRFIRVTYFFCDKDIPENRIPKFIDGKKTKSVSDVLEYVKALVDKKKDIHAVYQDECKVTTSQIVEFNIEEKCFINDLGIKYYMT